MNNLRGGPITGTPLNAGRYLSNGPATDTLLDDSAVGALFGGIGNDWFIAAANEAIGDFALANKSMTHLRTARI